MAISDIQQTKKIINVLTSSFMGRFGQHTKSKLAQLIDWLTWALPKLSRHANMQSQPAKSNSTYMQHKKSGIQVNQYSIKKTHRIESTTQDMMQVSDY